MAKPEDEESEDDSSDNSLKHDTPEAFVPKDEPESDVAADAELDATIVYSAVSEDPYGTVCAYDSDTV